MLTQRLPQYGFTLVEVMVTISIAAVLTAIALPSFDNMMENARIRNVTESLAAGLSQARNEAVSRNAPTLFSRTNATSTDWVICQAAVGTSCTAGNRINGYDNSNAATITVTNASAAQNVRFDSFGRYIGGVPATLVIESTKISGTSERVLNIIFLAGGQIKVCNPAVTNATDPRNCS